MTPALRSTLPTREDLAGFGQVEPWLAARVTALRSGRSPVLAAAAVGTVGRLGADPALPRRWAEALSDTDRRLVEHDALRQVDAAWARLARVAEAAVRGEDGAHALYELVDLRDVLASAAWVLGSEPLDTRLRDLDAAVRTRWSELPPLPEALGDLCAEVAWREPWAWWGRLV
ncbi:MAG: hypothetical protein R3F59_31255 [Myxococcota bacterium]